MYFEVCRLVQSCKKMIRRKLNCSRHYRQSHNMNTAQYTSATESGLEYLQQLLPHLTIIKTEGTKTSVGSFMIENSQTDDYVYDVEGNNAWDTKEEAESALVNFLTRNI